MQRVVCRNRNSKMNSRTSESTKNVAVKEEPADRGYGEPITVTNIPTSTAQDTRNGKESLIYQMNEINSGETKKERTRWIMLLQRALRGSYWHEIPEPMIPSSRTCTVTNLSTIDPRGVSLPHRSHK